MVGPDPQRIGLIAGNGSFPLLVLDAARSQGLQVVVAAIKEEAERRLRAGVALGATTLEELALNAQSESVRLQAAQALLDRGGMQLASLSEHHVVVKDERSDDELRARVEQLQRELGLSAKVISGEVVRPRSLPAPVIDAAEDIFQ